MSDAHYMARAIELARRGEGHVEPNPMVGCVIVRGGQVVGEGWHARFGGPHAEVMALEAAGRRAAGGTLYVTLEPCCHQGKTAPCTGAIEAAGVGRVVAAVVDPFPHVAGEGLRALKGKGIEVETGPLEEASRDLLAPYLKRIDSGRPWVLAKWAMTLDGKIATRAGHSRWISGEGARARVHELRGRMDAIVVGRRTAQRDDPLLTARPPGPRQATRIVVDTRGKLSPTSQLVQTAGDVPVLVAVSENAPRDNCQRLEAAGCDVHHCSGATPAERLDALLRDLGRRQMTNILVEGGGELLGTLFDLGQIDEVHAFVAPRLVGGAEATTPVGGTGVEQMDEALALVEPRIEQLGDDTYIRGRVRR